MLRLLYSLLLSLVAPFFLYGLYKRKPGKPSIGERWKEHFGYTSTITRRTNETGKLIWIHAVSVGEVLAVSPFIRQLKQKQPSIAIVLTTTTSTGAEQAEKLGELIHHRYMPLDFGFALRRFIRIISPSQLLIMETELWPNTLHFAAKANISVTILNARLSQRSCNRYKKVQRVFDSLAKNLTHVLCQTEEDKLRFSELGLPHSKLSVTGSIKFDVQISEQDISKSQELKQAIGSRLVWVAASTHEGEDDVVLNTHRELLRHHNDALLIIVPRHPERFDNVYQLSLASDLSTQRRTISQSINTTTQVYLADTMGEMMAILGAADVCFMGGSLLGNKVGGHNLLEPAALGVPTLIGPSFFNFKDITRQLVENQATKIVEATTLTNSLNDLFDSPENLAKMGQASLRVVAQNRGSINASLKELGF